MNPRTPALVKIKPMAHPECVYIEEKTHSQHAVDTVGVTAEYTADQLEAHLKLSNEADAGTAVAVVLIDQDMHTVGLIIPLQPRGQTKLQHLRAREKVKLGVGMLAIHMMVDRLGTREERKLFIESYLDTAMNKLAYG